MILLLELFTRRCNLDICDNEPQSVSENSQVKLLQDLNIYTDHILSARRPNIVSIDKCNNIIILLN